MIAARSIISARSNTNDWRLSNEKRKHGITEISKSIISRGLDTVSPKVRIIGCDKNMIQLGTDRAQISSIDRYESFWSGLLDWCIFMEDYESGIIVARDIHCQSVLEQPFHSCVFVRSKKERHCCTMLQMNPSATLLVTHLHV